MELDLGGYVKEYAADRVAALLRAAGCRAGLVDLGGDLAIVGPHPDGQPWIVGIRDASHPDRPALSVPVIEGGVATSGDYERCMVVDGVRYGHILDPRTGWPMAGLASVTVFAPCCLVAGSASTIALLQGERARAWLDALGLPHARQAHGGEIECRLPTDSRGAAGDGAEQLAREPRGEVARLGAQDLRARRDQQVALERLLGGGAERPAEHGDVLEPRDPARSLHASGAPPWRPRRPPRPQPDRRFDVDLPDRRPDLLDVARQRSPSELTSTRSSSCTPPRSPTVGVTRRRRPDVLALDVLARLERADATRRSRPSSVCGDRDRDVVAREELVLLAARDQELAAASADRCARRGRSA